MYTVAAFPSTTSPYLRPSSTARGRCRQTIRNVASLASSIEPHELDQLGPVFAFTMWVAARSLIILWTMGYERTYGPMPADLEPLLKILHLQGMRWPCAQRYAETIQLILDTKASPGGPVGLDVFNDTKQTSYGVQKRLGKLESLLGRQTIDTFPNPLDFMQFPSGNQDATRDLNPGIFGHGISGEWL